MKLLGVERIGGRIVRDWLHTDGAGKDVITTETVQDVEPILERNKRKYNDAPQRFGSGAFHEVADIPATVIEKEIREQNISLRELVQCKTDKAQAIWRKLLNDRDLRGFRTRPGRVDVTR